MTSDGNDQKDPFVLKAFIQTPDAVVNIERDETSNRSWNDIWTRKCGNP